MRTAATPCRFLLYVRTAAGLKRPIITSPSSPPRSSWISWAVLIALLVWSSCGFFLLRPKLAVLDFQGWRQADTQTIAENLTAPGASLFYPQIAWGGDGPGYVETEMQLYTEAAALLMRAAGPGEWAGQLVSTLAIFAVGLVVFFDLRRRRGPIAAVCGVAAILGVRAICHLATSIQPDALSLLFYAVGWSLFLRYRDLGRKADLVGYTIALTLAMLTKPPSGQLGISCVLVLLLSAPGLLKRRAIWIAWIVSLAMVGLYLLHAHSVYAQFGNSFGLFKGGNEKVPTLGEVLSPVLLAKAMRTLGVFGVGYAGAAALAILALRRRFTPEIWALLAGNLVVTVFFIRVTADFAGVHYLVPAALLSAEAVGVLVADFLTSTADRRPSWNHAAVVAGSAVLIVSVLLTARIRPIMGEVDPAAFTIRETGLELSKIARPDELIIVRAKLYDPRIFYVAHLHGWQLSHRVDDPAQIPEQVRHGARYFIDPLPNPNPNPVKDWLQKHARRIDVGAASSPQRDRGAIWALPPAAEL